MWCDLIGEQQTFLWISGWSVPADIWQPYCNAWPSAKHYTLSFEKCEQTKQIMEQATHTLQQIDAKQLIIVGWSLGAMVALQLALRSPHVIDRLFLIGGVTEFVSKQQGHNGWNERVLNRMKKQLQRNAREVIRLFDQKMFSEQERQASYEQKWSEKVRKQLPPLLSLLAGIDYLRTFTLVDQGSHMQMPVYLLTGSADQICPTTSTLALAKQLPHATYTIWQERGHACFWTQQERFIQWIKRGLLDEHR
jgi:pimeloyl-[acyl-carrier protein] methyl ester esterase